MFWRLIDFLMKPLIRLYEVGDSYPVSEYDAIVAIGTALMPDGSCSPQSRANTELAARFYQKGIAPRIIFTSGNSWGGPTEARAMKELATSSLGLPFEHILVEDVSKNTHENAVETKKILDKNGWRKVLIIADSIHARRVLACFKKTLGLGYAVKIYKSYSERSPQVAQKRLRSEATFFIWELLAFAKFKKEGWV